MLSRDYGQQSAPEEPPGQPPEGGRRTGENCVGSFIDTEVQIHKRFLLEQLRH
jgi:hypothetical protein